MMRLPQALTENRAKSRAACLVGSPRGRCGSAAQIAIACAAKRAARPAGRLHTGILRHTIRSATEIKATSAKTSAAASALKLSTRRKRALGTTAVASSRTGMHSSRVPPVRLGISITAAMKGAATYKIRTAPSAVIMLSHQAVASCAGVISLRWTKASGMPASLLSAAKTLTTRSTLNTPNCSGPSARARTTKPPRRTACTANSAITLSRTLRATACQSERRSSAEPGSAICGVDDSLTLLLRAGALAGFSPGFANRP